MGALKVEGMGTKMEAEGSVGEKWEAGVGHGGGWVGCGAFEVV